MTSKIRHFGVENYQTLPKPNNSFHNNVKLIVPEPVTYHHEVLATIFVLVFLASILGYGLWLIH